MEAAGVKRCACEAIGPTTPTTCCGATMAGLAALRSRTRERNPRHETGKPQEVSAMSEITYQTAKSRIGCTPNQKKTLARSGCAAAKWLRPSRITCRPRHDRQGSHLVVEVTKHESERTLSLRGRIASPASAWAVVPVPAWDVRPARVTRVRNARAGGGGRPGFEGGQIAPSAPSAQAWFQELSLQGRIRSDQYRSPRGRL